MFSHVTVGSNDLAISKKFYDALLATVGVGEPMLDSKGRYFYMTPTGMFGITKPIDGHAACHANGGTIGFACSSPEQVEAWHAAGVANGGTTCEDPPGVRDFNGIQLHLAYLRDPDGNKLCGLYRYP
ncbi:MAG: VOC family protein [Sphingobium sp.]|nr:VOC family protein [Sphingobium sp.]